MSQVQAAWVSSIHYPDFHRDRTRVAMVSRSLCLGVRSLWLGFVLVTCLLNRSSDVRSRHTLDLLSFTYWAVARSRPRLSSNSDVLQDLGVCFDVNHLTCERQLHMRTSLDRAQANTCSMQRILKIHDCSSMVTGPYGPRNDNASFMAIISAVFLEWCSGTRESEMSLGGDDGTKHDINPSIGEIVRSHDIQREFHHPRCEYLRLL